MSSIPVPELTQLNEQSQAILGKIKMVLDMVPNIYATLGYSSNALESYLAYNKKAGSYSFNKKEIEVIKLAVSEVNQCLYCLAAHTAIAKINGFTEEDTQRFRAGKAKDQRYNILANTAKEIALQRGKISDSVRIKFFNNGFNHADFVELISVVNSVTFTNYLHNATGVPIDFPAAMPLAAVEK